MLMKSSWTELWQVLNLGSITTNQKANDEANEISQFPTVKEVQDDAEVDVFIDSEVMDTVRNWLQSQPNSFYEKVFTAWCNTMGQVYV
ncbi:hypothetical protein CEXT_638491 [Caerostris extrusa]|uniref:Uncharacterized protein n=1 Tax=Caerostris extrusa TaxID=172846 RepID=A0AAV4T2F1_CAEEX|nr:hypothetical protein CEXT_638491 [Caerostris extrusa]